MCTYDPIDQRYPGDERMRTVRQLNKENRLKRKRNSISSGGAKITFKQYKQLLKSKRVCTDLSKYEKQVHMIKPHKSPARCGVCGDHTYKRCDICKMPLHNLDIKGIGKGKNCASQWHSETYLGLCFDDRSLFCMTAKEWKPWSSRKLKENIKNIKRYSNRIKTKH